MRFDKRVIGRLKWRNEFEIINAGGHRHDKRCCSSEYSMRTIRRGALAGWRTCRDFFIANGFRSLQFLWYLHRRLLVAGSGIARGNFLMRIIVVLIGVHILFLLYDQILLQML